MLQYQIYTKTWATTLGMKCYMSTDMQANTQHIPTGLVKTDMKQTISHPFTPLQWGKWATYHLLALLRRYISGEKEEEEKKKETGHKQQYYSNNYRYF